MKFFISICFILVSFSLFADCYISQGGCELSSEFQKYNKTAFKGDPAPEKDPAKGLKYITPKEALKYIKDPNYVFIDTRPASLHSSCKIRKSKNFDYGYFNKKDNQLTKKIVKDFIDKGKTVVYYCNALKCHRSLNAALQSYAWGFPSSKIKWLGKGIPGVIKTAKSYRKYVQGKGCTQFIK